MSSLVKQHFLPAGYVSIASIDENNRRIGQQFHMRNHVALLGPRLSARVGVAGFRIGLLAQSAVIEKHVHDCWRPVAGARRRTLKKLVRERLTRDAFGGLDWNDIAARDLNTSRLVAVGSEELL